MSLSEDLIALKNKYMALISEEVANLEKRIIDQMLPEMKEVVGDQRYVGYSGGVEGTVEMFVTNQIIECAISHDASGDWDGYARAEDLEQYINGETEWVFVRQGERHFGIVDDWTWNNSHALDPEVTLGFLEEEESFNMDGFAESMEGIFEYEGSYEEGRQKLLEQGMTEVQVPVGNLPGQDWHFMKMSNKSFGLVRKDWWEKNHYLDDSCKASTLEKEGIKLPDDFWECEESIFEYNGPAEEGCQALIDLGMTEIENPWGVVEYDEDEEWDK